MYRACKQMKTPDDFIIKPNRERQARIYKTVTKSVSLMEYSSTEAHVQVVQMIIHLPLILRARYMDTIS